MTVTVAEAGDDSDINDEHRAPVETMIRCNTTLYRDSELTKRYAQLHFPSILWPRDAIDDITHGNAYQTNPRRDLLSTMIIVVSLGNYSPHQTL